MKNIDSNLENSEIKLYNHVNKYVKENIILATQLMVQDISDICNKIQSKKVFEEKSSVKKDSSDLHNFKPDDSSYKHNRYKNNQDEMGTTKRLNRLESISPNMTKNNIILEGLLKSIDTVSKVYLTGNDISKVKRFLGLNSGGNIKTLLAEFYYITAVAAKDVENDLKVYNYLRNKCISIHRNLDTENQNLLLQYIDKDFLKIK